MTLLSSTGFWAGAALFVHVACLLAAPYSSMYHRLKNAGLVSGAAAALLLLTTRAHVSFSCAWTLSSTVLAYATLLCALCLANFSVTLGAHNFRRAISPSLVLRVPFPALIMILCGAVFEESIWRVGVQSYLGNNAIAIVITTVLFHRCHIVSSKRIRTPKMLDLWCFSAVCGIAFALSHNLYCVVLIHGIRNVHLFALRCYHEPKYRDSFKAVQNRVQLMFRCAITHFVRSGSNSTSVVEAVDHL